MDDASFIPASNIRTNDKTSPSDNLRLSSLGKWSSNEKQPEITVQLSPDGTAIPLGEVQLPSSENVLQYVITITNENDTQDTFLVNMSDPPLLVSKCIGILFDAIHQQY